jgi:arginine utilization protein RocB
MDYFQRYPEQLQLLPISGDHLGRKNVVAVVRGKKGAASKNFCVWDISTLLE